MTFLYLYLTYETPKPVSALGHDSGAFGTISASMPRVCKLRSIWMADTGNIACARRSSAAVQPLVSELAFFEDGHDLFHRVVEIHSVLVVQIDVVCDYEYKQIQSNTQGAYPYPGE
jgi:hypothetical protein